MSDENLQLKTKLSTIYARLVELTRAGELRWRRTDMTDTWIVVVGRIGCRITRASNLDRLTISNTDNSVDGSYTGRGTLALAAEQSTETWERDQVELADALLATLDEKEPQT